TEDFLFGQTSALPGIRAADARRYIVSLLRQAWDYHASRFGLAPYRISSNALVWYFPKDFIDGNVVSFVDVAGKTRRKKLVGWSPRRNVHWHFGIEAKPVVGQESHFVLRPHVIFTTDGKTPLESKD